jgi:hypothetical protein
MLAPLPMPTKSDDRMTMMSAKVAVAALAATSTRGCVGQRPTTRAAPHYGVHATGCSLKGDERRTTDRRRPHKPDRAQHHRRRRWVGRGLPGQVAGGNGAFILTCHRLSSVGVLYNYKGL